MNKLLYDDSDEKSIFEYAKQLEGHDFQWVLDLGIAPDDKRTDYSSKNYKGAMGNLLEERYFGYPKNSDERPDFPKVGMELKSTPLDFKKKKRVWQPGERLVITMIPFDKELEDEYEDSHLASKLDKVLLIFYKRKKREDSYTQQISRVLMLDIPERDMDVIKEDYRKIASIVQAGKAEELSESLTNYLGACTKGSEAAKSFAQQFYPPHKKAKRRAFCLKNSYMKYYWEHYVLGLEELDAVQLETLSSEETFESLIERKIEENVGKTDKELAELAGIPYIKDNKARTAQIIRKLLGVKTSNIAEFEKSNTELRVVRLENNLKSLRESISLKTQTFQSLLEEAEWEESKLYEYFSQKRFFFVVFKKEEDGTSTLLGSRFWNMPVSDLDGPLRECWEKAREVIAEGVKFNIKLRPNGEIWRIENNLPGESDNPVAHMRRHANKAAYMLYGDVNIGDIEKDADELPDGQKMTKQSFWLNKKYVYEIIDIDELGDIN